jgi:hypothetical protein
MARRRGFESVRDMVLSLGVVLGFVGLILLMTLRTTPEAVKVVDATPVVDAVASSAPYAAVLPGALAGWRVTSARVSPAGDEPFRWHIGYYTPAGQYAAAGQSNGLAAKYLADEKAAGTSSGSVTIGGVRWTKVVRADGKRNSLVRTADGVTTLVTGGSGFDELTTLASGLRPAKVVAAAARTPEVVATSG